MVRNYFKFTFYMIFFLTSFHGFSKEKTLDSLVRRLEKSEGRQRVDILNRIANNYSSLDAQKAMEYAMEALELSQNTGYKTGEADAMNGLGSSYLKLRKFDDARRHFLAAEKIFIKLKNYGKIAESYNLMGEWYSKRTVFDSSAFFYQKALNLGRRNNYENIIAKSLLLLGSNSNYLGDYQKALNYYKEGLSWNNKLNDKPGIASAHEGIAHVYRLQGKYDEGLIEFHSALNLNKILGDKLRIGACYNGIGQILILKGDYTKGVENHLKSLKIFEEADSKLSIGQALNSLGIAHMRLEDYKMAISYFNRCLKIQEEIGNKRHISSFCTNLGAAYYCLKNYDSALVIYKKALKLAEEIKIKENIGLIQNNIALIHLQQNRYDSALIFFHKYLSLAEESGNETSIINAYNNIGTTYLRINNASKSIFYANKAMEIAKKSGANDLLKDSYLNLSEAYSKIKDYRKSLDYYKSHIEIRDSLLALEKDKLITKMETEFKTVKKDKELAQKNLAIQKQKLALAGQRNFIFVLMLSILILIVIGILFRFQQKKRRMALKMELEQKNIKIRQQLELTELKSNFFTNISHEFRTPLTLILTPLEQLAQNDCEEPMKKQYNMMQRNANHLLTLVNQILDLSKMESGYMPLKVSQLDLISYLEEIIQSFSPLAETLHIRVNLIKEEEKIPLFIDKEKLDKVIHNLLGNAFKYTASGGTISVIVHLNDNLSNYPKSLSSEGNVQIIVKDNGRGIPKEHLPFIFDRFYQVDGIAEKGTGIGLALSKEIVEMHYGDIQVKSAEGEGSEFVLKLPLGKAHFLADEVITSCDTIEQSLVPLSTNSNGVKEHSTSHKNVSSEHSVKKNTVLVVEDNSDVKQYLNSLLGTEYDVLTASNGNEGLEIAAQYSPDLIISDIMMPNMDGYEFTSKLKCNLATSHIPIILLTAKADQADKLKGLKIGVDDYIVKPFHADELLIRSKGLIEQRLKLRKLFAQNPFVQPKEVTVSLIDEHFLKKATNIVVDHMEDQGFDVEKFCREIGMSHTSLHNKLKALTDQSITRFIRGIRLQKAVELIEQDFMSMTEIAYAVGFNNRQFFIRSFKEQYEMTPTDYKAMIKKKTLLQ